MSAKLQALWDANTALLESRNRLRKHGCVKTVAKIEAALRSVGATFAAENKRLDRTGSKP